MTELRDIPLDLLDPSPFNTRVKIDPSDIAALAESMKRRGQIESMTVRPHGDRYEIVTGELRWRALKRAGISEARCIVREMSDEDVMMVQWEENENRVGYRDYAKALKLSQIAEAQRLSQRDLAEMIGKSAGYVNNFLQMLKLTPVFTTVNAVGLLYDMTEWQARSILRAPDELLNDVVKEIKQFYQENGELPSAVGIDGIVSHAESMEEFRDHVNKGMVHARTPEPGVAKTQTNIESIWWDARRPVLGPGVGRPRRRGGPLPPSKPISLTM